MNKASVNSASSGSPVSSAVPAADSPAPPETAPETTTQGRRQRTGYSPAAPGPISPAATARILREGGADGAADSPRQADLIVVGGDVVTMDQQRRVYRDGAVAIRGDRIVDVGPAARVRAAFPAAPELDARGCVITPGLVNAHQHTTGDPLVRGVIPDDIDSQTSIFGWAVPLHTAHTPEDDECSALLTAVDCLLAGITTVVEPGTVAHPERVGAALARAGIRAALGTWGWDAPGLPFAAPAAEVLDRAADVLRAFPPGGLVSGWVTLVGHDLVSDELFVGAAELAERAGTRLTFHLAPSENDVHSYLRRTGVRPVEHLRRLGVLGPRVLIGHAVWLDDEEIDTLAATDTAVACCPWAYLRLGQGLTRAGRHVRFRRAGGRLALGCDSHNAGDAVDVLRAAALLAGLSRDAGDDPPLGAAEAFELATVGGAAAVGLAGVTGALAPGLAADLVVFDARRPAWTPRGDLARQLVWSTPTSSVRDVLVAGRRVVAGGRVQTVDTDELGEWAAQRSAALLARAGLTIPRSWPLVEEEPGGRRRGEGATRRRSEEEKGGEKADERFHADRAG